MEDHQNFSDSEGEDEHHRNSGCEEEELSGSEEEHNRERGSEEEHDRERGSEEEHNRNRGRDEEDGGNRARLEGEERGEHSGSAEAILEEIREMLARGTNVLLSEEMMERFGDLVAEKTFMLHKKEREKERDEAAAIPETWVEGDQFFQCRPCGIYSQFPNVPSSLRCLRKGVFGSVAKIDDEGNARRKGNIKASLQKHEQSDLHIWCVLEEERESKNKKDTTKRNEEAGKIVIRNVIKALKHGQSSVDFQSDNNLFHLTAASQTLTVATKNDSRAAFFKIRDVIFEVVSEKVRDWFVQDGPGCIDDIAITLDKVTVNRVSFTVLLTYFFWEGKIYVLLNKLNVMNEDEYDSEGTARAVVEVLLLTLGVSKTRLANLLRHFAYDGVYATDEERVGGGGSLNLIYYVALELDLDEGDVTGTWDVAHQLQIIWHRSLKQNPEILDLIKIYFNAMQEWNLGKASTIFLNRAKELGNIVLTNKNYQTTRFVRSLIRGLRAAMQNLPTIIAILANDYEEAALDGRNTDALEINKMLKKLRSSVNLVKTVGVLELLEIYAETSLESQHASYFPTQVWTSILKSQSKLEDLASKWKWSNTDLKFSVVEAPTKILERLLSQSEYKPKVLEKNLRGRSNNLREAGLLDANEKVSDLFNDDEEVKPIAGVAVMSPISPEEIKQIEVKLQNLAADIGKEWKKRHKQSPLETAAYRVFGEDALEILVEGQSGEGNPTEGTSSYKQELMRLLQDLIAALPSYQAEKFISVEILPGYISFLNFWKLAGNAPQHKVYEEWYKRRVLCEGAPACNALFASLFQNLQIRSSSEAIAETVGSIMNNHTGKGR